MELKTTVLSLGPIGDPSHTFTILPQNLGRPEEAPYYHSTALSFFKYARDKIDVAVPVMPDRVLVQKSADVYLPILKFAVDNWASGAPLLNMLIEVAVAFIKDTHPGSKDAQAKLTVIVEETLTARTVRLDYAGPVEGLKDIKMDAFKDA
jgi:hypothetical protein